MVTRAEKYTTHSQSKIYFSDFLTVFRRNPRSGVLEKITNSDSVRQSLKNLILTNRGERFYQPTVGGDVNALLFENVDNFTAGDLQEKIVFTIRNNEERVQDLDVQVDPHPDMNEYRVIIYFTIINNNTLNNLNLTLKRVR